MLRALMRFGAAPLRWLDVHRWCAVVARHLVVDRLRRARRAPVDADMSPDVVATRSVELATATADLQDWISAWRPTLSPGDCATLDLLVAGVHDNGRIAALRARTLRAVQASRQRIAAAAARAPARVGNLCRPLHARSLIG